jgi:hypothetical protein
VLRGFDIDGLENEGGKSTTCTDRIKHALILRYNVLHTRPPSFVPARIPFSSVSSFTTQFTDLLIGWFARGSVDSENHHVPGKSGDSCDTDVNLQAKIQLPTLVIRASTLFYK